MPFRTDLRRTKVATQSLALASSLMGLSASALGEPPSLSLDRALGNVLALGRAEGCSTAFGIPDFSNDPLINAPERHDEFLRDLRNSGQLGKEVAAICGTSAVASAAALGGSLGSLQTTKTVSQFRIARHRLDSRLDAQDKDKRSGSVRSIFLAAAGDLVRPPMSDASELLPAYEPGIGVFGQADYERRKRDASDLETGYKADIVGGVIGIDYATANGLVIGAWAGYQDTDANFRGSGFGAISRDLANALTPGLVNDICNIGPGGGFDDRGGQFGGFAGARAGKAFADLAVQYSRRDYDYRRNVCAIETPPIDQPIVRNPDGSFRVGDQSIDDIYAGKITGETKHTEWSVSGRAGYDFGNERLLWGPRLSVTYLKSKIDGFTENGRTSVTNPITSVTGILETERAAGDPTGLELTFDDQSRTSIQSELQLLAAYRIDTAFGVLVPRASASWIHEFKGERERIKVRMAQDLRAEPTRFSFTTDRLDKNKGVIAVGLTAVMGRDVAADIEVARLVADDRFDSTTVRAQARWRF